ncbi:MAG: hypothetical protein WBD40_12815 [Tepidisphaeraceae bacterium]
MLFALWVALPMLVVGFSSCGGEGESSPPPAPSLAELAHESTLRPHDLPSGVMVERQASTSTLIACGADRHYWNVATARAASRVMSFGDISIATTVGVFATRSAATNAFGQLTTAATTRCYRALVNRRVVAGASGYRVGGSTLSKLASFPAEVKHRAYRVLTPVAALIRVDVVVDLAVVQIGKAISIMSISNVGPPPRSLEALIVRAIIR